MISTPPTYLSTVMTLESWTVISKLGDYCSIKNRGTLLRLGSSDGPETTLNIASWNSFKISPRCKLWLFHSHVFPLIWSKIEFLKLLNILDKVDDCEVMDWDQINNADQSKCIKLAFITDMVHPSRSSTKVYRPNYKLLIL